MGNLFIGFPVPRAKIAEMIEGKAPPLEHKQNHEPDGIDPLALPGDISTNQILKWNGTKFIGADAPTGGLPNRYADTNFFFHTDFPSLDGLQWASSGSGNKELKPNYLWLYTSATANSKAEFFKITDYPLPTLTWNKARRFRTRVYFRSWTNELGEFWVSLGRHDMNMRAGFLVKDGILKGFTRDGSTETTVNLETLGTGSFIETRDLEMLFTPGSKAEFYVDGSKQDEITTTLPTGTYNEFTLMDLAVKNLANAKNMYIFISQFTMYQAA